MGNIEVSNEDYEKIHAEDWEPKITVNLSLRNIDGNASEISIEQRLLGMAPYLLLVPEVSAEEVSFNVSGSEFSLEDVLSTFETVCDTIRQHLDKPSAADVLKAVLTTEERKLWLDPDDASEIITEFEAGLDG